MDFLTEERGEAFRQALADQARQQWLAAIDARIKAFSEHARRSDAQKARWALWHIRRQISDDKSAFETALWLRLGRPS